MDRIRRACSKISWESSASGRVRSPSLAHSRTTDSSSRRIIRRSSMARSTSRAAVSSVAVGTGELSIAGHGSIINPIYRYWYTLSWRVRSLRQTVLLASSSEPRFGFSRRPPASTSPSSPHGASWGPPRNRRPVGAAMSQAMGRWRLRLQH